MACSGAGGQATVVSTTAPEVATTLSTAIQSTTGTVPTIDEGDLIGWELVSVSVGEETLLVAVADDPAERAQGLMRVEDFGDLDGMLFVFPEESFTGFWMKDTPVRLDIAFFDLEGILVDTLTMDPCEAALCPVYQASVAFAWALETPAGSLRDFPLGAALTVGNA